MNFVRALAVAGLMMAGAASAFADTFTSSASRFSATFPGAVTQGATSDNATDPSGKVISRTTEFSDSAPGRYIALLIADAYITPYSITAATYLPHNIKGFTDGLKVTATQKDVMIEGNPAIEFSFSAPDRGMVGKGLLVFVPDVMPRGYMLATVELPEATADDKAKLNAFLTSFDIK